MPFPPISSDTPSPCPRPPASALHRRRRLGGSRLATAAGCAALVTLAAVPGQVPRAAPAQAAVSSIGTVNSVSSVSSAKPMFAYYYLWWSTLHWHDKLGANYPFTQTPPPLPATLDATECGVKSLYTGNHLLDAPASFWTQDDPVRIETDVRLAAGAGLAGFLVNWKGNGSAAQTVTSTPENKRLDLLVKAVLKVRSEGIPFSLWLDYKGSTSVVAASSIVNDGKYVLSAYGAGAAMGRLHNRLVFVWTGSRKYALSALTTVSSALRPSFYLLGDETSASWTSGRASVFDGDQYYWSSQNPWANPQSFQQVKSLAAQVRSTLNPDGSAKTWVAPVTPGFDTLLNGGTTCVPRRAGGTLRALYQGNAASNPDAWALISWNEIAENTYVVPLRRFGSTYLGALKTINAG